MNGNPNEGLKPPKRVFLLKTAKNGAGFRIRQRYQVKLIFCQFYPVDFASR
jgi:hypothetical protein